MSKHLFTSLIATMFGATCALAADLPFVFSGLLHSGTSYRFVLTDADDGMASGWLSVNQVFHGCLIVSFDAKAESLTVKDTNGTRQLPLVRGAVKEKAGEAEQTARAHATQVVPVVIMDREIDPAGERRDSNGEPFFRLIGGRFERTGQRIAIEPGKTFGLTADLAGLPAGAAIDLDYLIATPPMRYPDGRMVSSAYCSDTKLADNDGTLSGMGLYFTFDHDYEMVPGRYRLELRYKSKLLAAQDFDLYLPNAAATPPAQAAVNAPQPALGR